MWQGSAGFCYKPFSAVFTRVGSPLTDRFFFFFSFLLIYFWLCWVFVAVRGLLIAVASLVVEHGLWAQGLQ